MTKRTRPLLLILLIIFLTAQTCWPLISGTTSNEAAGDEADNDEAEYLDCANLRLTSPLGGMANGFQTFYWDALEGAVAYRLNIYDDANSAVLVSVDAGNSLNTSLDVSQAAIGGETPLTVELLAFDANGNSCSQRYEIGREAAPPQIAPETTPD